MEYGEALEFLLSFTDWRRPVTHRPEAIHNVPRMRCLLELLGNPDRGYGSAVIAGTKGKGSTAAMLAALLAAAGQKVGLYSQPHLHDYRERVRVGGVLISEAALVALAEALKDAVPRLRAQCPELGEPSTYDLGTALALAHFATEGVDVAVLEVGLGGRFDAVNAVTPRVSLITSLSMDHMAVLGDTIEQIAMEKAGIAKAGVPILLHPQELAAREVVERAATERGAPLLAASDVVTVRPGPRALEPGTGRQAVAVSVVPGFPLPGAKARSFHAELPLLGSFQRINAASAIAAALVLTGGDVANEVLRVGLSSARWPGRLEIVRRDPLTIVDGAHNASSAAALRDGLRELFPNRRVVYVLGTSIDKDIAGIVRELATATAGFVATTSTHARSAPVDRLVAECEPYGVPVQSASSLGEALATASARAGRDGLICVTGSLFLVADARAHFGLADVESSLTR